MFTGLMTGVSGIRGIVGEGITPEVVTLWAGGFGSWVKGRKVIVARDSRPTGEMLSMSVKAALCAAGCDVDDIGIVPTPTAALTVERRGAGGGIIITASHNPQQWNALKFVRSDGRMLTAQDFNDLQRTVTEGPLRSVAWNQIGMMNEWDGSGVMHIAAITGLGLLHLEKIKGKRFKVALDCVNGAGCVIYPLLLEALGCEVVKVNCKMDGLFPRGPEPTPENIVELSKTVIEEGCVIGFAVDPDGDRLSIVDETGKPLGEEVSLALTIKSVLESKPGPVVVNCLTSMMIDDIAEEFGVKCYRSKVGEANVAAGMREFKSVVGGEGNGGIIAGDLHYVRDAGVGMALLLNRLANRKQKISEFHRDIPKYHMIKKIVPLRELDADEIISSVKSKYEHDQISTIDGLRVIFQDGWVQVRPSNTEPILRVYSESKESERALQIISQMLLNIESISD